MGSGRPCSPIGSSGAIPYILPQTHESDLGQWFPRGNRLAQIL